MRIWVVFSLAAFLASACSGEIRIKEAKTPREHFDRYVVPELERRCAAETCHGLPLEQYRALGPGWFKLALDPDGGIHSPAALEIAYAEATGAAKPVRRPGDSLDVLHQKEASAERRLDRHAEPEFSELVRKALPEASGGLSHAGGDNYVWLGDPGLARLLEWIRLERSPEPRTLTPLQRQFRDEALPALARRGCLVTSCHGPLVGNMFKVELGVDGRFSDALALHAYKSAKGFLSLGAASADRSRLLAKALPVDQGGIIHRGSNRFFSGPDDADLARLRAWIDAERAAAGIDVSAPRLVYVRRPPVRRDYFDVGAWAPGADLWRLDGLDAAAPRVNLTARWHEGPADIRSPEVSPDGSTIVFAMRKSVDDCLNLYAMPIDGSRLEPLTADTGCRADSFGRGHVNAANLSPRFSPDGRIYFVSTRERVLADKGNFPDTSLWSMRPDGSELRQDTIGGGHETDLSLANKGGKAILLFTALRDIGLERHAAVYFLPPNFWMDYHPFYGEQSKYPIFAQPAELPDNRVLVSLQPWGGLYEGGALAVFDRNMGPDIEDESLMATAAVPAMVRALSALSEDGVSLGTAAGPLYRNPVALPDGRVVVASSTTPVDPRDPTAAVHFRLVLATIDADPRTRLGRLGPARTLVDEAGWWAVEPAVIVPRVLPNLKATYIRDDLPPGTGLIQLYDAFTLETILRDNRPIGRARMVIPEIAGLRAVFAAPTVNEDWLRLETPARNGDPWSTRVSNGVHGRRYAIGPVPIESDGSVYFRLPAMEPFFLQNVDGAAMAIGAFADRWQFLGDGEAFGNGVARPTYDRVCGGCHGSYDGGSERGFAGFDTITSASATLATHESAERRKSPLDATRPEWRRQVSFKGRLQALLEDRCVRCHGASAPAAGLDLSATSAGRYAGPWSNGYESLHRLGTGSGSARAGAWQREYVDEREARARRSHLIEKIYDRELDAPRALVRGGCRAAEVLDEDAKAELVLWVDLGATYLAPGDAP